MIEFSKLDAARKYGLIVDDIILDGQIHRVPTQTKPRGNNGWYVTYPNSPAILVGDWAKGGHQIIESENHRCTKLEKVELRKAINAARKAKRLGHENAAHVAQERYDNAQVLLHHPYLTVKHINMPEFVKVEQQLLLVPLFDISQQKPQPLNLQTIDSRGNKYFLKGGRVSGLCCPLGASIWDEQTTLYIAEGFATAMSIHMKTDEPALVAFNAGNLINVAKQARQRWPARKIVIAGDDDWLTAQKTGINVGVEKATKAALLIGAQVAFPPFTEQQKQNGLSDWNDYLTLKDKRVTDENET